MERCRPFLPYIIVALILSFGMIVGAYFIGNILYKAKIATNIASVKGLAEREVKADIAIWTLGFSTSAPELKEAYKIGEDSKAKVIEFLKAQGFAEEEITPDALNISRNDHTDNNGNLSYTSYDGSGGITVRTTQVDKVAQSSQKVGELIGEGVLIQGNNPQYIFTKLNDIKPEMLGEATRNARVAAEQFAKDANAKVGNINEAMQGAFNFSARDSADEYGGNETASIYKKVRVVTTISFYLEN